MSLLRHLANNSFLSLKDILFYYFFAPHFSNFFKFAEPLAVLRSNHVMGDVSPPHPMLQAA